MGCDAVLAELKSFHIFVTVLKVANTSMSFTSKYASSVRVLRGSDSFRTREDDLVCPSESVSLAGQSGRCVRYAIGGGVD